MQSVSNLFQNKRVVFIVSIVSAIGFFLLVYFSAGVWFETNDDVFISELLAGKITGIPEMHIPYVSIIFTAPISLLYRVFPSVPWWGIFVSAIVVCSVAIVFNRMFRMADTLQKFFAAAFFVALVCFISIYEVCQIQYTSAAMLLAVSGYFLLIRNECNRRHYIAFFIIELISCAVRDSAMMIVQPMCVAAFAGYLWGRSGKKDGLLIDRIKIIIRAVGLAVSVIVIVKAVSWISFSSPELKLYKKADDTRIYLVDYQEVVEYSRLEDILTKYNIDEIDYQQFLNGVYRYPETEFTEACYDELLVRLKDIRREKASYFSVGEAIKQQLFTSGEYWHMHQFTAVLFLATCVMAVLCKSVKYFCETAFTFAGYLVGLFALSIRNRYVLRIMLPYYLGASLFLLLIILSLIMELKKGKALHTGLICFTAVISVGIFSFLIGKSYFAYGRRQNMIVNAGEYNKMAEIYDYCNSHPGDAFLLDLSFSKFVSTPAFDTKYYNRTNCFYTGSWYSKNPSVCNYGIDYLDNGYCYIVYETQEWQGQEGMEYYAAEYELTPKLLEKHKLSNGATLWIYRMQKEPTHV